MTDYKTHIWSQFNDTTAKQELENLKPSGVDWVSRTRDTIELLLPLLGDLAESLVKEIPRRLNSIHQLLHHIDEGRELIDTYGNPNLIAWYSTLFENTNLARLIIAQFESQQISAEIQRYIVNESPLKNYIYANGNSIYPDLVVRSKDYTMLPKQNRTTPIDGPCLKGVRPSNVPDGCEIKTNDGMRVKVDAHGAHAGLHLAVTWKLEDFNVTITGVWGAYVRFADHKESKRNVGVTTIKHSFGHELFISLLPVTNSGDLPLI